MDDEYFTRVVVIGLIIFIVLAVGACSMLNWQEYKDRRACVVGGYADTFDWQGTTLCIGYTDDGAIRIAPLADLADTQ